MLGIVIKSSDILGLLPSLLYFPCHGYSHYSFVTVKATQ
uniref:Uncharacterized protein n=1 Tax=Anguilla anguilla TaxID=7936 RepID=A0A0E9WBV5_ANGAN